MQRPKKIVLVEWEDALTVDRGGWCDLSELLQKTKGDIAETVGFLVARTDEAITLAGSMNFDKTGEVEQVSGTFVIPMGMVRKVRTLK